MRKTISLLLILPLLIGTIPTAFAADDAAVLTVELTEGKAYAAGNMQLLRNAFESAEQGQPLTVRIAAPGTYYVGDGNRAWRLRSDTTFDMNGATLIRYGSQGNLIQNADYSGNNTTIGGYALSHDITIKNGILDGAGDTGEKLNLCNIGHAVGIHLDKVTFKNGNSHLVEFSGCRDCTVTNCTFSGYCPGTDDACEALQLDISDNDVSGAWNGVYFSDSTPCRNITVDNCDFLDFPSGVGNHKGILGNHNSGIVIKNCRFKNTLKTKQPAIWSYDFDDSEISGNTINGVYSSGITLSANRNTVVKNNTVKLAGIGIYVTVGNSYVRNTAKNTRREEYGENCSVTGNTVTTTTGGDISVCIYSGSGVKDFSSNTVTSAGNIGVSISSKSKVTNVKNNTVKAPKGVGMAFITNATVGKVSGNTVTAKDYGFQVTSSATVTSIKSNPSVISSGSSGIYVSSATAKSITGNTVKNCASDGISVTSSGVVSAIDSNTVTGCGGFGVRVNNTALTISFSGNKLTSNKSGASKINAKIKATALATPKITSIANAVGGVKLTWGKVTGAAKYRIFYKSGSSWKKLADTAAVSYLDKTLASGKARTYTVRCMDKNGKFVGSYNTTGWTITYVAAPALPSLKNTKNGVQLTFTKPAGATYIRIFRKTGSGGWQKLADTTAKTYVDKSAKKGVKYTYTLRVINKGGSKYLSAFNTAGRAITCKR